ncbi:ImmA/IrrE family metallo-endopeptidase [Polymorphobacter sp. PAMC 29334]|uniref:ImmA/IrrE family metallo-endopeptidase n=1 Tax=Polymorphobacter sp. PAMC 29334 TaxID=2862331 RepID=UPI001C667117|nr:ImmA/IrrE family metallo-endopeptidase [Polymorphobacter sp. PAMC 29334]QYE33981.1 ImmA/IrrE family metallo-endopeptidase [Polymorphobacter sp. PAMC 29334]
MTDISFSSRISAHELNVIKEFLASTPVKIGGLAKALGLDVVEANLPLNISGMIKPRENGFVIKVNRYESKSRQRFTIAHEIAHYLLHRQRIASGVVDSVLYRSNLSSTLETEANKLAADLIMPWSAVRQLIARNPTASKEELSLKLADEFKVSRLAADIRVS